MLVRVSKNFAASRRINFNSEFLKNLSDCSLNRRFAGLDHAAGEIPCIGKWDRVAATIVTQLHEDFTVGSLQK